MSDYYSELNLRLSKKVLEQQETINKLEAECQREADDRAKVERHLIDSHNCRYPFKRCPA